LFVLSLFFHWQKPKNIILNQELQSLEGFGNLLSDSVLKLREMFQYEYKFLDGVFGKIKWEKGKERKEKVFWDSYEIKNFTEIKNLKVIHNKQNKTNMSDLDGFYWPSCEIDKLVHVKM